MRILVDEGMPVQVMPPLQLNRRHEFDHVDELGWKGKPDIPLFRDAADRGYEAVLTLDVAQLDSFEDRVRSSAPACTTSGSPKVGVLSASRASPG